MSGGRDTDRSRQRDRLHSRRDIYVIAVDIPIAAHDLADMDSNTKVHPSVLRYLLVDRRYLFLDGEGALNGSRHAGKLGEYAVPGGVRDASGVLRDESIGRVPMRAEQAQGAGLIGVHEPGIAGDIGTEYRREASLHYGRLLGHANLHRPYARAAYGARPTLNLRCRAAFRRSARSSERWP